VGEGPLDLDTRDLAIESITDGEGRTLAHTLHPAYPVLGARLRIELPAGTRAIRIRYKTVPTASARQWLEQPALPVARGGEIGRFNMGSTVVVLLGSASFRFADGASNGDAVRMGQALGTFARKT
jgi:hypothetical protein